MNLRPLYFGWHKFYDKFGFWGIFILILSIVRAVSPGNYKIGPVSANAMYNGEYHSYNGAG